MEKRALLAIALSIVVLFVWQLVFGPLMAPPAPPRDAAVPEAAQEVGAPAPPEETVAQAPTPAAAAPAPAVSAEAKADFRLITGDQDIRLTNEGGRATWWRLTRYTANGGIAVDLIPEQARQANVLPLQVEIPGDEEATRALATALHQHTIETIPASDPSNLGPGQRVTFTWSDGRGLSVRKVLEVPDSGYVGHVSFSVTRDGRPVTASLVTASGLSEPARDDTTRYGHVEGQGVVHNGFEVVRFPADKVPEPRLYDPSLGQKVIWAGLESTYFASLALGPLESRPGAPAMVSEMSVVFTPRQAPPALQAAPTAMLTSSIVGKGGEYALFVGPKDYSLLNRLGQDLVQAIHFSDFDIIYWCTRWLFLALTAIKGYVGNYGWSIIILTIFVRLLFFPISYKSMITMRQTSKKMAKIQPRVKAIQDRYRKMKRSMETQQKMNQEIMTLYKKEGVNPMANLGGCLPLLLQMPVFIAFYNLLAVTIELRQAPFMLWIDDLSRRDPYWITPVLMGASWLVQQAMTSASIPDPMQRRMMLFMPAIFTIFMINMPSGLVLYWLTNNVLGMIQQYLINKKADQLDAAAHGQPAPA